MDLVSVSVLIGFLGACFLAASVGAAFRPGDWYERLVKPSGGRPTGCFLLSGRFSI